MSKKLKTDLPEGKRPLSMQEALDLAKKDKAEREAREAEAREERDERRKRLAAERTPLPPPASVETDSDEVKQPVKPEVFELADEQAPTAIGQPYVVSYKGKLVAYVQIAQRSSGDTIRLRTGGSDVEGARAVGVLQGKVSLPLTLAGPGTPEAVDQFAADLHAEAPHMRAVTSLVRERALLTIANGAIWFQLPPIILYGEPGTGKSSFVRFLAQHAKLPSRILDGSAMTSPAPLIGTDGSWRTGRASEVLLTIADHGTANPIIGLDEVDKLTDFGRSGTVSADSALLSLLEPGSARQFPESFLRQPVDLSFVSWVMTANDPDRISAPIRDRCVMLRVDPPSLADFEQFTLRQIERRELAPELIGPILKHIREGRIRSFRKLNKILDAASAALARPMLN